MADKGDEFCVWDEWQVCETILGQATKVRVEEGFEERDKSVTISIRDPLLLLCTCVWKCSSLYECIIFHKICKYAIV